MKKMVYLALAIAFGTTVALDAKVCAHSKLYYEPKFFNRTKETVIVQIKNDKITVKPGQNQKFKIKDKDRDRNLKALFLNEDNSQVGEVKMKDISKEYYIDYKKDGSGKKGAGHSKDEDNGTC